MFTGVFKCWCHKWTLGVLIVAQSSMAAAEIKIDKAWVKLAPPGAKTNAAYLRLYNAGDQDVVITSLSADCCASLVLHRTRYENDKAIMEHLDHLSVPARNYVQLVPGGLHIMLMQIAKPLRLGDRIELHLHLSNGQQQTILLPVKKADDD